VKDAALLGTCCGALSAGLVGAGGASFGGLGQYAQ
jgi:hypothetical protein